MLEIFMAPFPVVLKSNLQANLTHGQFGQGTYLPDELSVATNSDNGLTSSEFSAVEKTKYTTRNKDQ